MKKKSRFPSALKEIGENQHFNRIDLLYSLIIGQEYGGAFLNSRRDLQGIGQSDREARPDKRRRFRELFVNQGYGKRRKRLKREFDFVGERKVLIGERLC
jgi:hypothetical protein